MNPTTPGTEARRVPGQQVASSQTVRLTPGGEVELLNISATGALVETRHRLATGTSLVMSIGGDRPQRLPGEVVRSTVTAIHRDSTMTYQLGIAFRADTKFEGVPEEPDPAVAAAAAAPADVPTEPADGVALVNEW